jgi:hypothetical protein
MIQHNLKALRGFFCTRRSPGLNITSVVGTARSALAAFPGSDGRKSWLVNRKTTGNAPDKFYPDAWLCSQMNEHRFSTKQGA